MLVLIREEELRWELNLEVGLMLDLLHRNLNWLLESHCWHRLFRLYFGTRNLHLRCMVGKGQGTILGNNYRPGNNSIYWNILRYRKDNLPKHPCHMYTSDL